MCTTLHCCNVVQFSFLLDGEELVVEWIVAAGGDESITQLLAPPLFIPTPMIIISIAIMRAILILIRRAWKMMMMSRRRKCSLKCWKCCYREINMQRFCAQCISSWASSDKTLQSYSPDNSLFHTFPVTDDDAYTCTVPTSNHMCIHRYQQVH